MAFTLYDIPSSSITDVTIQKMHELIKQAKIDYQFVNLMRDIVKNCPPKDSLCEIKTMYSTLKNRVKYNYDPEQVEWVQSAWYSLKDGYADCDCATVLMSSAMGALGYPYRFVVIKADKQRPDEWSHIFPEIEIPRHGWLAADLTVKEAEVGWRPRGFPEKIIPQPIY